MSERMPTGPRAPLTVVAAMAALLGGSEAGASEADKELSRIARLGPACTALVGAPNGSDVNACKAELTKTAEEIKRFVEQGAIGRAELLAGNISHAELCSRAARLIDEHRHKIDEIITYLSTLIRPDASDIVSTTLAPTAVQRIKDPRGIVDSKAYETEVRRKLAEAREQLVSCGFAVRAVLAMGGLTKARSEIQTKLPALFNQLVADIQQVEDKDRLVKATVSLVGIFDILRAAAGEGYRE